MTYNVFGGMLSLTQSINVQGGLSLSDGDYLSTVLRCMFQRSNDRRYLLCPAYASVSVLKKFIHVKFELTAKHRVRCSVAIPGLENIVIFSKISKISYFFDI